MPMRIAKAFCYDPVGARQKPVPEPYDFQDHAVQVDFYKDKWRSRVTGPRAALALKTCAKTFTAETKQEARSKAEKWMGEWPGSDKMARPDQLRGRSRKNGAS